MNQQQLYSLAAADALAVTTERYRNVHDAFSRDRLSNAEVARLQRVYDIVARISVVSNFEELWQTVDFEELSSMVGSLGEQYEGSKERKAYHDLKGGSIFCLGMLARQEIEELFKLFEIRVLALDQAKLMRALFSFLDPEKAREEESAIQVHTVSAFLESYENRLVVGRRKRARIQVENSFEGAITCRCVETSALDRLLVNLTNNAVRFVPSETSIRLVVFQASEALCRFCVLNEVETEQRCWLADKMDDNGLALFRLGVTQGSTGLGLGSSADIVGQAFGLPDTERLVKNGYIGVALRDLTFCAWFHWPVYQPRPSDELCPCIEA